MSCNNCKKNYSIEQLFKCDGCQNSLCSSCSKLSPTETRVMSLKGPRTLTFYCPECKGNISQIPDLRKMIELLQQEIQSMKTLLTDKTLAVPSDNSLGNSFNRETIITEVMEREHRAKNIVIFGLKESESGDAKVRYEEDLEKVDEILQQTIGEPVKANTKCFRLGKKTSPNKNRPLKIILDSRHQAFEVLKNKGKLLNRTLKINSDQTPAQRNYLNELRDELKRRTDQGDANLTIKYIHGVPKIVTKN